MVRLRSDGINSSDHAASEKVQSLKIEQTQIPDVLIVTPNKFGDSRGYFSEVWNRATLSEAGIDRDFVQDNQSYSKARGTVRGLHFQSPPHAQAKLVRCGQGRVLDVAVDIRQGSPTFGEHVSVELSAENGKQLFIPEGFLHGFSTLTDDCVLLYKCSDVYAPECDGTVQFSDPALGIDWGVDVAAAVLSDKDAAALPLSQIDNPFKYEGQS